MQSESRFLSNPAVRIQSTAAALLLTAMLAVGLQQVPKPHPLLLAPLIGGLWPCLFAESTPVDARHAYARGCMLPTSSAAPLVASTLAQLTDKPAISDRRFELGYAMALPLLRFMKRDGAQWAVDVPAIKRVAKTLQDEDRPVIVYLFSNHFGVDAPVEQALLADPANLMESQDGPMGRDKYYGIDVFPWSFVKTDNGITRMREQVTRALLDEICRLPAPVRERVRGVTVLGELHHMFPGYENNTGFAGSYRISDYSAASVAGFRIYLAKRFGNVVALNKQLGANFESFDAVSPPAKDVRTQTLGSFFEHIDPYAHGVLQVSGWTHVQGLAPSQTWIRIYRDGELAARVPAKFSRQDVAAVHPEYGTADVGWSHGLDFSRLAPGFHKIEVVLERAGQPPALLASRRIAVMDRSQSPPAELPVRAITGLVQPDSTVQSAVDAPADQATYYFNPLVPLWHAFRQQQVRVYLDHFRGVVAESCIPAGAIYSHQILPGVNPGWDVNKFAVDDQLDVPADMGLGVSLYGEASYGTSFTDQFARMGRSTYGITEFHPLRAMDSDQLRALLLQHRARGAQFVSFFMDAKDLKDSDPKATNFLAFSPSNEGYGSRPLFDATRQMLK